MKYIAIRSEGGLIPDDLLEKIANEDAPGQKAADFGLAKGRRLSDEIQRVWSDAQDLWDIFNRRRDGLPEKDPYGTTLTRERWIVPLLTDPQILGYELKFQPTGVELHGLNFPISHWAGEGDGAPPVHIEGFKVDLDRKGAKLRTSPRAMVQEFLNHSEAYLWGIVTNGLAFRLLRDSARTARPTYLEFDLESILEGNHFNEFAVFYRLCHRSRLPKPGQEATECLLEQYHQLSIEQGGRVRDKLRDGVEDALKALGTGFLLHPGNEALRAKVAAGRLPAADYHRQLLRLVYRLLFLMVAEERRMIVSKGENAERHQRIYRDCYSVSRLRERAEGIVEPTVFSDLWLGLKQTFLLFSDTQETNPLGIPPLNGDLFSHRSTADLDETQLYNHELLLAIRRLSMFADRGVQQRVNYSALDVEELGSVYESLLDFHPVIEPQPSGLVFDLRTGSERKTTGSYYTRPELVHELIQSALVPVMEDRLAKAEKESKGKPEVEVKVAKEKAILGITVCDSACGSGHFLLAAARRLGRELARIRTGEDEPSLEQFHLGVRDAVSHCIYGVDLNPLAVDLCKLALWLEGHWTGKPLSFLDHRIKCGNSLVGVFDLETMKQGIPDDAFNPVAGDDKKAAQAIKKRNKRERESPTKLLLFGESALVRLEGYAEQLHELVDIAENSPADVRRKADLYRKVYQSPESERAHRAADLWTAAFFVPIKDAKDPAIPTHAFLMEFLDRPIGARPPVTMADNLKLKHHFFHWPLEFPEVFAKDGFDVVLGNPPWERIKLQEEEFFSTRDIEIAKAPNKAARQKLIHALSEKNSTLAKEFEYAKHAAEAGGKFARESDRFPLTSVGDINTYALFAELSRALLNRQGRAGIIVPTGIATDNTTKNFFTAVAGPNTLVSLHDFENAMGMFAGVGHGRFKFCLLTLSGAPRQKEFAADFLFHAHLTEELRDDERHFTLSAGDMSLLNPNTRTCPIFRSKRDAEITKAIYRRIPVLVREGPPEESPWGISFMRMFDMANDSNLFRTREELEQQGWALTGNIFVKDSDRCVPLYEAKMVYFWTHRYGDYAMRPIGSEDTELPRIHAGRLENPSYVIQPRYWVSQQEMEYRASSVPPALVTGGRTSDDKIAKQAVSLWAAGLRLSLNDAEGAEKLLQRASNWSAHFDSALSGVREHSSNIEVAKAWQKKWPLTVREITQAGMAEHDYLGLARRLIRLRCPKWFLGFRDIARSTDERTAIFSLLPKVGVGHTAPLAFLNGSPDTIRVACFLGSVDSLVFDYVMRQKIGGTHLTYNLLEQLPVLPPETYSRTDMEFISPRVLELVYTAWDIKAFADDVWRDSNDSQRQLIRCVWETTKPATGAHEFKTPEWVEIPEDGIPLPPSNGTKSAAPKSAPNSTPITRSSTA